MSGACNSLAQAPLARFFYAKFKVRLATTKRQPRWWLGVIMWVLLPAIIPKQFHYTPKVLPQDIVENPIYNRLYKIQIG